MGTVTLDRQALPILHTSDALVIGGSLAGVAAALTLARAGRRVALVESRTYLGREITATLRPWIPLPVGADPSALPEVVSACIEASRTAPLAGEFPLHPDAVKIRLEDLLLDAGVKLLYASTPVGLCAEASTLHGVVIGNKSGRQVLVCRLLVDGSETALLARLAGAGFEPEPPGLAPVSWTLEFDGVVPLAESALPVPPSLGLAGHRVLLHRGYRGQGHVLVELELALPNPAATPLALTRREVAARQKAVDVAAYLLSHVPAFRSAHLATLSYESHGLYISRLAGPNPEWATPLDILAVQVHRQATAFPPFPPFPLPSSFAAPLPGLWCLNEAARVEPAVRAWIRDPLVSASLGTSLARIWDAHWELAAAPARAFPPSAAQEAWPPASPSQGLRVAEPASPQRGRPYPLHPVRPSQVPALCDVDVLVVGGGTSGAVAAIVAAREGMRTCIVEMNPGLGGTGTYGGVDSYWCGNRRGFVASVVGWVNRAHDYLSQPRPDDLDWPRWNVEAKTHAWLHEAQDAGVEMLLNAPAIGAVVQGNAVRGVVVATRTGPAALLGRVVVDATGDGDVAAFAGAATTYGSTRDHAVMWYSLPQIATPGRTWNNFTSMVDVSNVEDTTRAILAGRRRGACHDHGLYVAPRESRHVWGDAVLTLTDQLLQRCWPDVVTVAFSNNDIKGQISSDWMRCGLIPPHLEIEIPYRALLPGGLENILVAGKALSALRDALSAIRMQPDLENLGGVAGLAAAQAVRQGQTPRTIDVQALQTRLARLGALPAQALHRPLEPLHYTDAELEALIGALTADRPLRDYSDMELHEIYRGRIPLVDVCCAGPRAVPLLERALGQAAGARQVLLAQALALVGSAAGVSVLVSAIQQQLSGDRLPERVAAVRLADKYAPDQAAMPDVVHLLYSLGLARDPRALPVWQRVVDLLEAATDEDIWSQARCVFHYVDAVCLGAEQLGDPAAAPILQQLHSYPPFHHEELRSGFQVDYLPERAAYLEVVIGRALARCGSPAGVVILINYLDDVRTLLAEHAHDHLVAVAGQDFGKDAAAWTHWLEMEGDTLQPVPWPEPPDPVKAWGETILVPPRGEPPVQRVRTYRYKQ